MSDTNINYKSKIGQMFCSHKNKEWYAVRTTGFQNISGEKRVLVCNDCGKETRSYFAKYEGSGFK